MSLDDMPSFGHPENSKAKAQMDVGGVTMVTNELPPETGLSDQDQKDAVKKVVKFFVIIAAVLISSALLYRGAVFAWHKYTIFNAEASLQKILDGKLIDAEREKYRTQYDGWVALVRPDYEQYYPFKSDYEFQKIVGAHQRLMQVTRARLGQIEDQIKRVLTEPGKSEAQLQEAINFWIDWKKDRGIEDAERLAAEEERQVKQYFEKIKPKGEPKKEVPPVAEAAPAPAPVVVEKSTAVAAPTPAVAPVTAKAQKPVAAPQKKQPQESTADRDYLREVQKMMIQK
jgi:hypothetical protein